MLKIFSISLLVSVIFSSSIFYFLCYNVKSTSVAFIRSQEVLDKYIGMDEAKKIYQFKVDDWQLKYDSLEYMYATALQNYESNKVKANNKSAEVSLARQQEILEAYAKDIEDKANIENEKLTQGVLNQVNEYVKTYAVKHNYDLVLGVTLSGNILYGADVIDITDKVIEGLNKEYSGK